jgi:hypothetical protein
MIIHEQRSKKTSSIWFDAAVVDNGDGTVTIPATTFWIAGDSYELADYTATVDDKPFDIYIEKSNNGGADYVLDFVGEPDAAPFGSGQPAAKVVWRNHSTDTSIHILRSISNAS